ncbi:hypothetical protein K439DRAFT_1645274 [Ramaria rubella]|nr:hypothetical protein K439DRAFT_1645274 [Ramaria rubella]
MSSAASLLPQELILEILESLYYTDEGKVDYPSLLHSSSVCRSWAPPAQQLLYRALVLLIAAHTNFFDSARSSISSPGYNLLDHVRILKINIDDPTSDVSSRIPPQLFAGLVVKCVRLYELKISASSVYAFDQESLSILSNIPSIKALSIDHIGVQSIILYQLISLAPSLRHLRLFSELHATPPREPIGIHLYELITYRAPHPDVMMWLLGASRDTLRILEMWDMCNRATMRTILQTHSSLILSLRLLHFNHQAIEIVQACYNLQELVLWHVPTIFTLGSLPSTIEHLAFRNPLHSQSHTLMPILNVIKELPRLRLITCDENATRHADFALLRAACAEASVQLKANALPFTVLEDLIPVSRFPRRKSVSNFRMMG